MVVCMPAAHGRTIQLFTLFYSGLLGKHHATSNIGNDFVAGSKS
jgi:hypothetical protein